MVDGLKNTRKFILFLLFTLCFLFVIVFVVSATDYYVSTTGNDAQPGTLADPFRTIQKAVNVSTNGDTIYIRGGIYDPSPAGDGNIKINSISASSNWLTITNYNNEFVEVNGSNCSQAISNGVNAVFQIDESDYIRITGVTINWSASGGVSAGIWMASNPVHHIRIDNCSILNSNCQAFKSKNGNNNITFEWNYLYNNFNNWTGILKSSQETVSFENVTDFSINNNTLINNRAENIDIKGGCNNGDISFNVINNTGDKLQKSIGDKYYGGPAIMLDARGLSHNITIRNNNIFGNASGISLNTESTGHYEYIWIYNNIINLTKKDDTTSLTYPAPLGIHNDGLSGDTFHHVYIYSNTVFTGSTNNYNLFAIGHYSINQLDSTNLDEIYLFNNVFYTKYNVASTAIGGNFALPSDINMANNSFYRETGTLRNRWGESFYTNQTSWNFGFDAVYSNPDFVDASDEDGDFHLKRSSLLIGVGNTSLISNRDFDGVTRSWNGYCIGAFEQRNKSVLYYWDSFGGKFTVEDIPNIYTVSSFGGRFEVVGVSYGNWSDWWQMTYANFAPPTGFDVLTVNSTKVNLTWTKNTNATHTHVRSKIGSYPSSVTDGVLVVNNSQNGYDDSGLNVGTHYYYRAWSFNSTTGQFTGSYVSDDCWTRPGNVSGVSVTGNSTSTITLSWTKGLNASRTVVRYSASSFPTTPASGSNGYNGTASSRTITGLDVLTHYYFSVWSYRNPISEGYVTLHGNTTAVGDLTIWVYKETEPWIGINNYSVFIKNQDGSQTYYNDSVNNPHVINLSSGDLPIGEDILIQINREGYHPRMIYMDLDANYTYNVTFYLAPDIEGGGDPSDPDYVPPDDSDNESYASHYIVIVKDEQSNPLKDVSVDIERYINETDSFESVYILYTDGNGEVGVDLIPNAVYQVTLSKSGYITDIENWAPPVIVYSNDVYKEFVLTASPFDPHPPDVIPEEITFTGVRTNTTIWLNYTDSMVNTINYTVYLFEIGTINGTIREIYNNTAINTSSFNLQILNVNRSNDHKAVLFINHTYFGNQRFTRIIRLHINPLQQIRNFGHFLGLLIGYNPFGWANLLLFLFLVAGLYYADEKDSGLVLMLVGGMFLFLNVVLGFSSTFFTIAGGVLPSLFFIAGIITTWKQRRDN